MRAFRILLAAALFSLVHGTPLGSRQQVLHVPTTNAKPPKTLHGRFIHITDFHPDPFYKLHSSTEKTIACHRGLGPAGTYGAETSDCDAPYILINATFKWIKENLRDSVDFVIWTGDNARHDNDEEVPRDDDQVLKLNRYVADKFAEVFGNGQPETGSTADMAIPVIPTLGNNDFRPHNVFLPGPNTWLRAFTDIWRKFIPEEQRHGFERGGWFYVEVIPNKLAVFSLNTMYFFSLNSAVDGCTDKTEPGFEHFEWLRIQLGFIRKRGMKAILMGHVPPARTETKFLWDETCWQKYTLWLQQYRDVVVGAFYGHMNIDHFLLQDTRSTSALGAAGLDFSLREPLDDKLTINAAADYLEELREGWAKLPNPSAAIQSMHEVNLQSNKKKEPEKGKKPDESKRDKLLKEIGGPWGERFQISHIGPSVVPKYLPTIRVVEYNISGLRQTARTYESENEMYVEADLETEVDWADENLDSLNRYFGSVVMDPDEDVEDDEDEISREILVNKKKDKKKKKPKKPKEPVVVIPSPPSKSSPPGPAYSPQSLTMLGYVQYFANITYINNDGLHSNNTAGGVHAIGWHGGKHKDKTPANEVPHPKEFTFEVEYSTFNDSKGFKLKDMTVLSYLGLAYRIGRYEPPPGTPFPDAPDDVADDAEEPIAPQSAFVRKFDEVMLEIFHYLGVLTDSTPTQFPASVETDDILSAAMKDKKDKKEEKKKKKEEEKEKRREKMRKNRNKAWLLFLRRAFVGIDRDPVESAKNGRPLTWLEEEL